MRYDMSDSPRAIAISQRLHGQATANGGIMWLAVDAPNDNSPPLPEALESALAGDRARPVRLNHPDLDPAWRPQWVQLNTLESAGSLQLQESITHALLELEPERLQFGQGRRIAGWIQVKEADAPRAMDHIAREMIRRHPAGGQRLLRLHDPAVIWALWSLLRPGQRRSLLGAIEAWTVLAPDGAPAELRGDGDDADTAWSADLWRGVDDITPLNAALRSVPDIVGLQGLELRRSAAMAALQRARELGFFHPRDLAAFAEHSITIHPAFDRHPLMRRALKERAVDDYYTALVDSLSAQDWQDIARSADTH